MMKDQEIRDKLHQILDLVLDINGTSERRKSITGNLPTVFFEFLGITAGIHVSVYKRGWETGSRPDVLMECYINKGYEFFLSLDDVIQRLGEIKKAPEAATSKGQNKNNLHNHYRR